VSNMIRLNWIFKSYSSLY